MNLSVIDRVLLLSALPKEGDVTSLRIIRKLREDLSFSEDEHKMLNFVSKDGSLTWNPEANDLVKDITIGNKAQTLIADVMEALNTKKKLTNDLLGLYELFVDTDKE